MGVLDLGALSEPHRLLLLDTSKEAINEKISILVDEIPWTLEQTAPSNAPSQRP